MCMMMMSHYFIRLKTICVNIIMKQNVTDFDECVPNIIRHLVRVQAGQLQDGVKLWRPLLCCLRLAHDENIAGIRQWLL